VSSYFSRRQRRFRDLYKDGNSITGGSSDSDSNVRISIGSDKVTYTNDNGEATTFERLNAKSQAEFNSKAAKEAAVKEGIHAIQVGINVLCE